MGGQHEERERERGVWEKLESVSPGITQLLKVDAIFQTDSLLCLPPCFGESGFEGTRFWRWCLGVEKCKNVVIAFVDF